MIDKRKKITKMVLAEQEKVKKEEEKKSKQYRPSFRVTLGAICKVL